MFSFICRQRSLMNKSFVQLKTLQRQLYNGSVLLSKARQSNEELIKWDDLPVPKNPEKDSWSQKRAMFGENDYKDILGDGTYNLKKNIKGGPWWLKGIRGPELKMLQMKRYAKWKDMGPMEKHNLQKRMKFVFRRLNKNKGKWMYHGDKPKS